MDRDNQTKILLYKVVGCVCKTYLTFTLALKQICKSSILHTTQGTINPLIVVWLLQKTRFFYTNLRVYFPNLIPRLNYCLHLQETNPSHSSHPNSGHIHLQTSGCTSSFSLACGLGGGAEVDDSVRGGRARGMWH
jgi:hypothetical protein